MRNFEKGDLVKFLGCSSEQIKWGNNDDPNKILTVNNQYFVEKVEVHSMHTKLTLMGFFGKFNSVCFEKI